MEDMKIRAREIATLLKSLSNENRLLILCELVKEPLSVGEMTKRLHITQSGISQHLTILKSNGILDYDKKAQTIFYKIKDERVVQLMSLLKDLYCKDLYCDIRENKHDV